MRNELLTGSERGGRRRFDLEIGADGLHSAVRHLTLGEERRFEHPLGYNAATFLAEGYPHRDEGIYIGQFLPGRQVWRFSLRENRKAFSFIFTASTRLAEISRDQEEHMAVLRRAFADTCWESAEILAAMQEVKGIYFDAVSLIRMPSWVADTIPRVV